MANSTRGATLGWRRLATAGLALGLAVSLAHRLGAQTTGGTDVTNLLPSSSILADRPTEGAPTATSSGSLMRRPGGTAPPSDPNAPVTFTADEVEYDRESGVVTARGHVEAWQGERVLRADEFTYNRETKVATARGNVQLLEADGQVLFADQAELTDQFKDGVLREVRALLAQNVRIAANGVRRTGGTINELSRVVYSSCDVCLTDPTVSPAWQVQARIATQDKDLQRITYRDATLQVHGIPVFYTPYLSHPDPSAERASGFLFPQLGATRYLGAFAMIPYYHVIDKQSDITVTPLFSSGQYPFLLGEYRNKLNFGEIDGNFSLGGLNGTNRTKNMVGGHIFLHGRFVLDENWRAGFDLNRATSDTYLQTIRTWSRPVYASSAYVEGFWGTEQYARIDIRGYQSLQLNYNNDKLPYALPNAVYEYAPKDSVAGGHLTLDTGLLSIFRVTGTHTQRITNRANWIRQEFDDWGGLWTFRVQGDANGYWAGGQQLDPVNLPDANGLNRNVNIRAAVDWRMPFVRYGDTWGNQILEPRVQVVTGPRLGRQGGLPNEDSIDFEFTDANLFALNRFVGRDRMEGGSRVDSAMRGAWMFPNGGMVEGLVGRSYTLQDDHSTSLLYGLDGLQKRASDWVSRLRVAPVSWFETMARIRTDGTDLTQRHLVDGVARINLGPSLSLHTGYLYATPVPYLLPIRSREEVSVGGSARLGNWRVNATAKYNISNGHFAIIQGGAGYEDECVIIEARVLRRFNRDLVTHQQYPVNTQVLMHIGLKTLGDYFFRAF
jgi:LPS-assembly protein